MTGEKTPTIFVSVQVADSALSERLADILAQVPGIQIAADGQDADVVLVEAPLPAEVDDESDAEPQPEALLSQREVEVLVLLTEGASNKEIARRLGISVHTAKFHVRSLMNKVDAGGRTEAVAQAARLHLIRL